MILNCYKFEFSGISRDFADLGAKNSETNEDSVRVVTHCTLQQ